MQNLKNKLRNKENMKKNWWTLKVYRKFNGN